jgi:hypothetical protein
MENDDGLFIMFDNQEPVFLSTVIDTFNGINCPQLAGKPKLFFFLDRGVRKDGHQGIQTHVSPFDTMIQK